MNKSEKILLKLGAIQTLIMACYHFFIPFQFDWGNYLLETSPTINWLCIQFTTILVLIYLS